MKACATSFLLCLLCLSGCETVRTVYDENGQEVQEKDQEGEKDLQSYFESQFESSFAEKKNKDGVPVSTSAKVSRYQKDLDQAQRMDQGFPTGSFGGVYANPARDVSFVGADKSLSKEKRYEGVYDSSLNEKLRPAFMDEGKGLVSTKDRFEGWDASMRSSLDGENSTYGGKSYSTHASGISTDEQNSYVEGRRNRFGKPRIMNYRDYYRKTIEETRTMLGRDKGVSAE